MKRIESGATPPSPLSSGQLIALAQLLSKRMHLQCPYCHCQIQISVEGGGFRMGSSPDLSALNPAHRPKPRLLFFCGTCKRTIGHIQGDIWSEGEGAPEPTRWDRLELEEL